MIVDEAAAARKDYIHIGILPLLMKENTACILITTPGDDDNVLNILAEKRERDDPNLRCFIVAIIEIVCVECKGTDRELTCSHIYKQPYWKDKNKIKSISNLYTDIRMARRELLGKDDGEEGRAFSKGLLEKFGSSKYVIEQIATKIYVGIDTDGCGDGSSETAIISVIKLEQADPKVIVLGLDSDSTIDMNHLNKMLLNHIDTLKKQRYYRSGVTKIIVMPEAYAQNTFYIADLFQGLDDVEICYTKKTKKEIPGMHTTNDVKVCGVGTIRKYLKKNNLYFSSTFFTGRFENLDEQSSIQKMKDKFLGQMKIFKEKIVYNVNGYASIKYSGKLNSKGNVDPNKMDDLVMALVICVYWMQEIFTYGCVDIVLKKCKQTNNDNRKEYHQIRKDLY